MADDKLKRAKDCYDELREQWSDNRRRMLEDLEFGDPADPKQWDQEALTARKGRPCLTLDRTGQYVVQVINSGRMNKPGINCMPVDSTADKDVAEALDGIIRHIEYRSRAQIAYDWALEGAARCGVGWLRVMPKVVDPRTNQQEITIARVADHLSVMIDGEQPDGSDAMNGFAETLMPTKHFKRLYPKASTQSWDDGGDGQWIVGDKVRVCEYQYVEELPITMLAVEAPDNGEIISFTPEQFAELVQRTGITPGFREYKATDRKVHWLTFNGAEVLEETILPGRWIGMVPVIGSESWVDGTRQLSGLIRRMMPAQRAYNYERSAMVEAVALQPKAPIMAATESISGDVADHWAQLNQGQPAFLPYNALDEEGRPLPAPQRLAPPQFPAAFAQGGQMAVADMEAAIGMNRSNLGMPGNATSGRQERERKMQGDVATFHFVDNLSRSIEHLGRIIVGMIPTVYDTARQVKILGLDGQQGMVEVNPEMEVPAVKRGKKVVAINPSAGTYDVRVKAGPGYTTQREEAAEGITAILQAAPQLTPILAPELARMRDWPNSENIARALVAIAPPEVRDILGGDEEAEPIPPQVQQQLAQMQQQAQQMAQMLDAAQAEIQRLEALAESKEADRQARIEEARIAALGKVEEAQVTAAADVEKATVEAQAQAYIASLQPPPQPEAPEAPEAPEPQSDPVAVLLPALMGIQQQLAELKAGGGLEVVAVVHERDPATGLAITSRPIYGRPEIH